MKTGTFQLGWSVAGWLVLAALGGSPALAGQLLDHGGLSICYEPAYRLARYVDYSLTDDQLRKRFIDRTADPFAPDPVLSAQRGHDPVRASEYARSGYDKGHLGPAEDFSWDEEGFISSFFMTNMAPQVGAMNQQHWKKLEVKVRSWACGEKRVRVITGPVLKRGLKTLQSGLPIPELFFKVVVDETGARKAAGFLYRNDDTKQLPENQLEPVERIGKLTKIDFAAKLGLPAAELRKKAKLKEWAEAACESGLEEVSAKEIVRKRKLQGGGRAPASVSLVACE